MTLKNDIELKQLLFMPAVSSLLTIWEQNVDLVNEKKTQYDKAILKSKPRDTEGLEHWIDTHFYHQEYEHLLLHSIFISLYSVCESHFSSIAKALEKDQNVRTKIKDIAGTGIIDKYRKYLFLVFEIEAANPDLAVWKEFERFQFLRNRIVHNESILSSKASDYKSTIGYQLLKTYPDCYVDNDGLFKITDYKLIKDFSDLILKLSWDINKAVLNKIGH